MTSDVTGTREGGVVKARRRNDRNAQLLRLLSIIRTLHRRSGTDIYDLAAQHDTTPRTIRRDLDALEAAGLPLAQEPDGRRMRWRIAHDDTLRDVAKLVDVSHYLAVVTALGASGAATARPATASALRDLAAKIERTLKHEDRARLGRIAQAFDAPVRRVAPRESEDVLAPLLVAIADQALCTIDYTSVTGRRTRLELLPLRVRAHHDALYVLGYLPARDAIVTLALDRIRSLRVLDRHLVPPAHLDLERYLDSVFGIDGSGELTTYHLRFDAVVAPYIRARTWHPSQRQRRRTDGGIDLTFTCRASVEVSAWVASWREHVEVLAPEELRNELAALGALLVNRYRD